jgi:HlyD family secretion protein
MSKRLIPLLLACAALSGCGKGPDKDAAAVKPAESPFAAIANGKVDVEGGIISVAARRGGIVREVFVQEGDEVVKGQILARQEDDEARLSAARAAAQVAQARAQLATIEARLAAARRELARLEKLVERNFIAAQRVDEQRDEVRQAEAALAAQKASIAVAQAQANEAAYNLELTTIRAPVDGRIIRRLANPGSGASTLNVSNMFDIEPRAPRIVRAEAPESALPGIFVGQAVQIVPEYDSSKTYSGKVLRRAGLFGARKLQSDDPGERADDRVVEVVVSADNPTLLIGQRVLVKFLKSGQTAPAPVSAARS